MVTSVLSAPLATHIRSLFKKQQGHDPIKLLGHNLNTFKQISSNLDGIQPGFYVIGGYTSMGKTTLMVNLMTDALESDVPCLYASLDDNKDFILNRMVSIKTGIPFNRVKKQLVGDDLEKATKAWNQLTEWADSGRFKLCDISDAKDLAYLETIIESVNDVMPVIFIDDVHNIPMPGQEDTEARQRYINLANAIKKLVDTKRIAIIGTTELRKRSSLDLQGNEGKVRVEPYIDDIMETGKFAYNANVIWFIYPKEPEKYSTKPSECPETSMVLKYAKNKLSGWTGKQPLIFDRTCGKLREQSLADSKKRALSTPFEPGIKIK